MFLLWLLWIIVVVGGFYMGIGYGWSAYRNDFEIVSALNALVYLGFAFYGLPKLLRLIFKR